LINSTYTTYSSL